MQSKRSTIFVAYRKEANLVTITDDRDCLPPDATATTSFQTSNPTLTAMQCAFTAIACGREYDIQM